MQFEYDPNKSNSNYEKHGINFEEAKKLWSDERLLVAPLKFTEERRFLCIGQIDNKHYSAVITYRGSSIRIISVRRSRKEEVAEYEKD